MNIPEIHLGFANGCHYIGGLDVSRCTSLTIKYFKQVQEIHAGEVTAAAQWQMQRAYELGVSKQALHQLLEQVAAELEMQVDEVYDSRLANVYSADRQRYRAVGKPFIEYAENKELQQLIGAVKAQTKDEFRNITQSMGFALPSGEGGKIEFHPIADYYQQTLDGAVMDIASGAFDYNTVLKRITHEMTNSGVRTVAYASGHTDRIEVAARRAVMTGFHQVVAKKAEQDMAALGTNYVEVTWHRGARPSHQVWQGKVYFWDRGFDDSLAEPPENMVNQSRETELFNEYQRRDESSISVDDVVNNMKTSEIGRETLDYIENLPERITLDYVSDKNGVFGDEENGSIRIYIKNCENAERAARAIIHECTHYRYGIGNCQWAECVCFAQELKHKYKRNFLTIPEKRRIIEAVQEAYPEYKWKKGGVVHGRKKTHRKTE